MPTNSDNAAALRMAELCDLALAWVKEGGNATYPDAQTSAYVELTLAFGLARLGQGDAALGLLGKAQAVLCTKDDTHRFLSRAYEFRVRQALTGELPSGPLPAELLFELEVMDRLLRYIADRLRLHSRILEPDRRIAPYQHWRARISAFERALAELSDLTDPEELAARVDRLLSGLPSGEQGAGQRGRVLCAALEVAPRVNEDWDGRLLEQALQAYAALPDSQEPAQLLLQTALLEKALLVASHFNRSDYLFPLVDRFQSLLQAHGGGPALRALESLTEQCCQSLRKLDMRNLLEPLLQRVAELLLEGQGIEAVDFRERDNGPLVLRLLLYVAAGWYHLGRDSEAEPVLEAARQILLQGGPLQPREQTEDILPCAGGVRSDEMDPKELEKLREELGKQVEWTRLACTYAKALGSLPPERAQKCIEELFKQLKGVYDNYTTSSHFMVSKLDVVESAVLALVGSAQSTRAVERT